MSSKEHQIKKVRQNRFPISLFFVLFGVLLLMSGIHYGFTVLVNEMNYPTLIQIAIPVVYWALVALGLTIYTKHRMKKAYDEPMQILAAATAKVAQGDFSVYMPPYHTADKLDYMDVMLGDFNKMVAELGSIETLKTDFFSNVSHEIKTPIAVIQSNAELLNMKYSADDPEKEQTKTILQATHRLNGLITNMLKLNKLEKQTIKPVPEGYDICAQLCECALGFETQWDKKELEFEADIEDSSMIYADAELMSLVWSNLLSNAIKFTEPGGKVTIRQRTNKNSVVVEVSDTGCGMSEETLCHIFDKFYQGDASHSTEGNGLGLALVLRILQLTDAAITAKSEQGKGSCFTVTIPLKGTDNI